MATRIEKQILGTLRSPLDTKDELQSVWQEFKAPLYPELNQNWSTEVCIVGGGIAGVTAAYFLADQGIDVTVIDDGFIGGRQTLRTTAHLSNAIDDRYFEIQRMHGKEIAKQVADSHTWAIQEIKKISELESINCEFSLLDGYLSLSDEDDESLLKKELLACHNAGLTDVDFLNDYAATDIKFGPCLRFPRQARFHPTKYVLGLATKAVQRGAHIFQHTRAQQIEAKPEPYIVTQNGNRIDAKYVFVATNVPVNTTVKIHLKQAAYRSYVIGCSIPEGSFPDILLWDTCEPYHYIRLHRFDGKPLLLIGGEDHRTGQPPQGSTHPFLKLYRWAKEKFPFIQKVQYSWSGQIIEPVDGIAYIGRLGENQENIFIATADSGHGITHGTIAGRIVCDQIWGTANSWSTIYDPNRTTFAAAGEFIKENINTVVQYTDWLASTGEDVSLPKKGGAICGTRFEKEAVYRDENRQLHRMSAVCPHMGGIVRWNDSEKTWDCPCHGSRFSATGEVINGPATSDLKKMEEITEKVHETEEQDSISIRLAPEPNL